MYSDLPKTWKTAAGDRLHISAMETKHIIATVRYLRRKGAQLILSDEGTKKTLRVKLSMYCLFLKAFRKELHSRKESRQFVNDNPGLFGDFLKIKPKVDWEICSIRSESDENVLARRNASQWDGRIRLSTGVDGDGEQRSDVDSVRWDQ